MVENDWEGEAAVRLETLAAAAPDGEPWSEPKLEPSRAVPVLPSAALLAEAADRIAGGEDHARVAAGFHATFCRLAAEISQQVQADHDSIALGGGCLVNRLLIAGLGDALTAIGLRPLIPRRVPPGDGGLAYGQAVLAAVAAGRGVELSHNGA